MRTGKIVLMGILMLSLAANSEARQQSERGSVRSWAQNQQRTISNFSNFEVKAKVRHVVNTGSGKRDAEIQIRFSGDPNAAVHRPEVEEFILNGEKLDTSGGRRVQQGLTSMMSPEIGPLLYDFSAPFQFLKRMRAVGGPIPETVDGEPLVRFNFIADGPPDRPEFGNNRRPQPPGNLPPGQRPRGNQPRGQQPPAFGPPGGGQGGLENDGPPIERVSFWFDQSVSRLVMSSSKLIMPGQRVLEIQSRYERIEGLDVPVWRTIKGSFSMKRRLRTTTVRLEHETAYSDYVFSKE